MIYPEDIELLLDEKYGRNAVLDIRIRCAQIKALRNDDGKTTLTISWDEYRIEVPVTDGMPIFISVRKTYANVEPLMLPHHLNDQIAWALGLRIHATHQEVPPEGWQKLQVGAMTLTYGYSGYTPYPDLLNLTFDGPITCLDAIKALEACLENRLYHRHPYKIRYLLSILKK